MNQNPNLVYIYDERDMDRDMGYLGYIFIEAVGDIIPSSIKDLPRLLP